MPANRRRSVLILIAIAVAPALTALAAGCGGESGPGEGAGAPAGTELSGPKFDCERLLNSVLPFAKEMLAKHREFHPFGGTMSPDGEIGRSAGFTGAERPAREEVLAIIEGRFRAAAERGEHRATALVFDVRATRPGKTGKQNAIAVALDHRDDYSVIVVFPYSFTPDGRLFVESPFRMKGANKIFPR